jgi:hypothetical protein
VSRTWQSWAHSQTSNFTIEVQVALKLRTIADWVLSAIIRNAGGNLADSLACLTDSTFVPEREDRIAMKKTEISRQSKSDLTARSKSSGSEINAFLQQAKQFAPVSSAARGRLIFALDATMSRQATWDMACALQGEMFSAAASVGNLSVQLVYFRGHAESRASRWVNNAESLRGLMGKIDCQGGLTQIASVLSHTKRESEKQPLAALVYVGDSMEENIDELCSLAGELGLRGVKAFMFHDGRDKQAETAFREIARLTGGAYLPFDGNSPADLKALLAAVATYAAGGRKALEAAGTATARALLADMR